MTRDQAIARIREIRNGGFYETYPDEMKGRVAVRYWDDSMFRYGMEYGLIHGLMLAFDLAPSDVNGD